MKKFLFCLFVVIFNLPSFGVNPVVNDNFNGNTNTDASTVTNPVNTGDDTGNSGSADNSGFRPGGAGHIKSCDAGQYRDTTDNTCKVCSAGTYPDPENVNACIDCPAGSFCPGESFDDDDTGTVAKYGDGVYAGGKFACPIGFYNNQTKQRFCIQCEDDTTTFIEGAESSASCSASLLSSVKFITVGGRNWKWPSSVKVKEILYNYSNAE